MATQSTPENGKPRIDIHGQIASRDFRFSGPIGEIKTGISDNATTPYELYMVGRINF